MKGSKTMKKFLSLFLAVLMIAVLIVPSSAKAGDPIITLDINTGAKYEAAYHTILTRIGENDTIIEVTGYLLDGSGKDYNYFYVYTVEELGDDYVITAASKVLGRETEGGIKSDLVIPENGFLLCFQAGDEANKALMDTVEVGSYVELDGVDLNELATLDPLANPLAGAATATIKAAVPDSYIWAKWDDAADNNNAPGFQLVLGEEDLAFLESGKNYKVFANVYFSDDATGNVYFNYYAYADAAAAEAGNWEYLNNFLDFASSSNAAAKLGTWASYESVLVNFGSKTYGGNGEEVGCKGMTIGMGFWGATGEVRVSECGIADEEGNVLFSKKFDSVEGLKLMGGMADETLKDSAWGVEGEKVAPPADEPGNPDTGDAAIIFVVVALFSMAGAVVVAKKAR